MSAEQTYSMWEKQVLGPVKKEGVAHGPFVLLTYPYDLPIGEIENRRQNFLLTQNLRSNNRVLVHHYGTDSGSDKHFSVDSIVWQSLGVNLHRQYVNEIYATSLRTKFSIGAVKPT